MLRTKLTFQLHVVSSLFCRYRQMICHKTDVFCMDDRRLASHSDVRCSWTIRSWLEGKVFRHNSLDAVQLHSCTRHSRQLGVTLHVVLAGQGATYRPGGLCLSLLAGLAHLPAVREIFCVTSTLFLNGRENLPVCSCALFDASVSSSFRKMLRAHTWEHASSLSTVPVQAIQFKARAGASQSAVFQSPP